MHLKDYYKILELEPSATQPEIKKAYRKLALQFHPDKTQNDPYASTQFAEIKEAYEVLTNPSKKEYYLQQRWYDQSTGTRKTQDIITPASILKQALELERHVAKLDDFRMDKYGLHDYIAGLVSDDTIEKLNTFNDIAANEQIIMLLINSVKPLPLELILSLQKQLIKINTSQSAKEKLISFIASREKSNRRDKFKIWVLLITTILLCLLIFLLSR